MVRDVDTKMLFAQYQKTCLKSDGEPALIAIEKEAVKRRQAETLLEICLAGRIQANGIAERAFQSFAQQVRVLRHSLQNKLGAVVP